MPGLREIADVDHNQNSLYSRGVWNSSLGFTPTCHSTGPGSSTRPGFAMPRSQRSQATSPTSASWPEP